jgi:hypothetical protein
LQAHSGLVSLQIDNRKVKEIKGQIYHLFLSCKALKRYLQPGKQTKEVKEVQWLKKVRMPVLVSFSKELKNKEEIQQWALQKLEILL